MPKTELSISNSLIKKEDRTGDGNLLPEVRKRVLKSIKNHLQHTGRLNVSEIASTLGLSRQTARQLTDEVLMDWQEEVEDQVLVQNKWFETILKDMDDRPGTFNEEKIELIKLKTMLLGKMNALQKLLLKDRLPKVGFYLIKREAQKDQSEVKPSK